jgi:hypothetical protein
MMALEEELNLALKTQTAAAGNAISQNDFTAAAQQIRACLFLEKFLNDIAALEE